MLVAENVLMVHKWTQVYGSGENDDGKLYLFQKLSSHNFISGQR